MVSWGEWVILVWCLSFFKAPSEIQVSPVPLRRMNRISILLHSPTLDKSAGVPKKTISASKDPSDPEP